MTAFTVLYGSRPRWQENRIGRVFFTKCVFLSLVLWQAVVSVWAGLGIPVSARRALRDLHARRGGLCADYVDAVARAAP